MPFISPQTPSLFFWCAVKFKPSAINNYNKTCKKNSNLSDDNRASARNAWNKKEKAKRKNNRENQEATFRGTIPLLVGSTKVECKIT